MNVFSTRFYLWEYSRITKQLQCLNRKMTLRSGKMQIFFLFYLFNVCTTSTTDEGCGFPGLPANARFFDINLQPDQEFPTGFVIAYECNEPFKLTGDARRICKRNGRWSGSLPNCVKQDEDSSQPSPDDYVIDPEQYPDLTPEQIWKKKISFEVKCGIPEMSEGSKYNILREKSGAIHAIYECKPGYYLDGETLRSCGIDGMWNGTQPKCVLIGTNSTPVEMINNGIAIRQSNPTPLSDNSRPFPSDNSLSKEEFTGIMNNLMAKMQYMNNERMNFNQDILIYIAVILTAILLLFACGFIKHFFYANKKVKSNSQHITKSDVEANSSETVSLER